MKKVLKRSLSLLLAITIILSSAYVGLSEIDFDGVFVVRAKAASSGTCGENLTWTLNDYGTLTISGTGDMTNYSLYSAMIPWLNIRSDITAVVVNNGVTSIGDSAFCYCYNITSITIPDSVTSIGDSAFDGCDNLSDIHITDIAAYCNITIYEGNYSLHCANNLYLNNRLITDLVIPDGVENIRDYAFYNCASLTSVTIPDSVTSIGDSAFDGCENLSDIYITDIAAWCGITIDSYYSNPFYYVNNLYLNNRLITDLVIPDGVENIRDYAFYNCASIEKVMIPDSVTSIGDSAFDGCENLTSVTIPDSVTSIGYYAFYGCTSLTSVTIPDSVTSISESAFLCGISTINVDENNCNYSSVDGVLFNKDKTTLIQYPAYKEDAEYTIPDSVKEINNLAFVSCVNLTFVFIPGSVERIGMYAFAACIELASVTILEGVKSLGEGAFEYCTSLTSIALPDSLVHVGYSVLAETAYFNDESNWENGVLYIDNHLIATTGDLSGIYEIKDGTKNIWSHAFPNNEGLTGITIPDSVTSIGDYAFYGCENLEKITIGKNITNIGAEPFCDTAYYNDKDNWSNGMLYIDNYLVETTHDLNGVHEIENGTKIIANYAFAGCEELTSITVPGSVTNIGAYAFEECDNLTNVYYRGYHESWDDIIIGEGNERLTNSHFSCLCPCIECNFKVTKIDSESCKLVTYIGTENDVVITSAYKNYAVTTIGNSCFKGSTEITTVEIEEGITAIGSLAFMNCTALEKVVIPSSVTSIGANAFYGFTGTIYCTSGSYTHEYAAANNIKYVLLNADNTEEPIQETLNTTIDYNNCIIRTSVQNADDIIDILDVSESGIAIAEASYVCGNLELYGTGTVISVFDGNVHIGDFTLIVGGDTNGDSVCDALDAWRVGLVSNGYDTLEGAYALAADNNDDDVVDVNDYQSIVNKAVS